MGRLLFVILRLRLELAGIIIDHSPSFIFRLLAIGFIMSASRPGCLYRSGRVSIYCCLLSISFCLFWVSGAEGFSIGAGLTLKSSIIKPLFVSRSLTPEILP